MHAIYNDDLTKMKELLACSPDSIEYIHPKKRAHRLSVDDVDAGDGGRCRVHEDLESLPRISITGIASSTPLHLAASIGSSEICRYLVSYAKEHATRYEI